MLVASPEKTIDAYVNRYAMDSFLNDRLLAHLQCFHFPIYSHVYLEQEAQHYLYFLVEGQVQCSHYHLNGKLAVFALSDPFTAIGDVEIMNREPVTSNVIATRPTIMLGIPSDVIHQYGADDPRFLRFLIEQLRDKLYKASTLHSHQVLPVINRLALYLLAEAARQPGSGVVLPDKEDLASLLGTTSRHLNRVLKQLVERGSISGGYPLVHIRDEAALQALNE